MPKLFPCIFPAKVPNLQPTVWEPVAIQPKTLSARVVLEQLGACKLAFQNMLAFQQGSMQRMQRGSPGFIELIPDEVHFPSWLCCSTNVGPPWWCAGLGHNKLGPFLSGVRGWCNSFYQGFAGWPGLPFWLRCVIFCLLLALLACRFLHATHNAQFIPDVGKGALWLLCNCLAHPPPVERWLWQLLCLMGCRRRLPF